MTKASPKRLMRRRADVRKKEAVTGAALAAPQLLGGETPPDATVMAISSIVDVALRNLVSIPQTHWRQPLLSALKSAYRLGQASVEPPQPSEDRVLEKKGAPQDMEEAGYDFIAVLAREFGRLAKGGLQPRNVAASWRTHSNGAMILEILAAKEAFLAANV